MTSIGSISSRVWGVGALLANGAAALLLTSLALNAYGMHADALRTAGGMPPLDQSWWLAAASMQDFPERIAWLIAAWFAAAGSVGAAVLAAMAWRWTAILAIAEIATTTTAVVRQAEKAKAVPEGS